MIKELCKNINEVNLLKIKVYGVSATFSFVFSVINVAIATYGQKNDMIFVVPFCVIFAILGVIGVIGFVINAYEALENSLGRSE